MQEPALDVMPSRQSFGIPRKYLLLALLTVPMWSGGLPIIGSYSPLGLRALWLSFCVLILYLSYSLPMRRLLYPLWPYLAWLACYLTLGLVVSPTRVLPFALTIAFYTIVFSTTIAIFTSSENALRLFANSTQWILVFNIIFLLLLIRYPSLQSIVTPDAQIGDAYQASKERFGGLWENPNMAGYVAVVGILLSTWATRWIAWLGRFSAVGLIYFSASRKASLMLVAVLLLNMLIVQRRNIKAWIILTVMGMVVLATLVFGNRYMGSSISALSSDQKIARITDIKEEDTGDGTRVDLFKSWLPIAARAPWYGYGLGAMSGYRSSRSEPRKELNDVGTHNTYLGIWIDVGPIGLLAFLIVFIGYISKYFTYRFVPKVRWALLSLMLCNVVILTVSHNHLFCAEGLIAFSLFFLLPTSPALESSRI